MSDEVIKEVPKAAIMDANGDVSSKRVWGFRFGWMTMAQVILSLVGAFVLAVIGKDAPAGVVEILQYGISTTAILCGLLFGLTVPEWFGAKGKK